MATNMEIRQKICHNMLHLFPIQDLSTLSIRIITPTSNSKKIMVFYLLGFIVNPPLFKDFDSNFVVVDRSTKMTHFIPCNKTITGKKIVRLFINNIYKYHRLSDDIIIKHGTQFTSKF